ncbi:hypothetical protein [Marinifilum sp.]|uniref:hypothetical protein n=1 Tax=Marinifilum sp. TaxID=2033137 RepID=UPI003BAD99AC
MQQAESEVAKKDPANVTKLKKAAIKKLNANIVGYMNTMAKVDPDTCKTTANTIAELKDKNKELVKLCCLKSDEEVDAKLI